MEGYKKNNLKLIQQLETFKSSTKIIQSLDSVFGVLSTALQVEKSEFLNYYNKANKGVKAIKQLLPPDKESKYGYLSGGEGESEDEEDVGDYF